MTKEKIPGYKILIGIAAVAILAFGAVQIFTYHHKTAFEKATGYEDYDAMIAAKIAYEEQVQRSITDLGGPGDDFTKAKAGDAAAQYRLGNVYLYGTQFEKRDVAEAMKWFHMAAEQKYHPAEYQVGRMYANGFSVGEDKKEAVKWYRISAEGGYKWAQIHLGEIYMHFLAEQFGAQRDFPEAYFWLSLGTVKEDFNSDFVRDRDAAEGYLKPEEVDAVKKRVKEWQATHPAPEK